MAVKSLCAALILAGSLAGCATSGGNPADPLEKVNRAVFAFNDAADKVLITPVAKGYRAVLPGFLRTGIANFFSNLEDVWISVNDVLQGKFQEGSEDFTRVIFNSTFGIGGLFDFASDVGLPKHNEDFGQTLGVWGVTSGPYVVLPIFGPSTFRDGFGLVVDGRADLVYRLVDDVPLRNVLYATRGISNRANLLDASSVLDQAALDRYAFVRDAWLQRRRNQIYDGNPPREKDDADDEPTQ
ncbi:MAG TPA: VacJ family lipoprotein [Burkholderiales bacterium]|nr:VacJ family lipoprotein [Burkholderiales bacterium]